MFVFFTASSSVATPNDLKAAQTVNSRGPSYNVKNAENTCNVSTMCNSTTHDDSPDCSPDISLPVRQQRETFLC